MKPTLLYYAFQFLISFLLQSRLSWEKLRFLINVRILRGRRGSQPISARGYNFTVYALMQSWKFRKKLVSRWEISEEIFLEKPQYFYLSSFDFFRMHFSRRVFRKAVLAHGPIQQPKNIHGMNPKAYVSIKRILAYYW